MHIPVLKVCKNIYKLHGKSCPASLFKNIPNPPPPPAPILE